MENGMMHFKLSKDELPEPRVGGAKKYDWPFDKMKVGECFYFPLTNNDSMRQVYAVRCQILQAAKEWRVVGKKFATRHVREKQSIGVWRVK